MWKYFVINVKSHITPLEDSLLREIKKSCDQVRYIGKLLEKLKTIAEIQLHIE